MWLKVQLSAMSGYTWHMQKCPFPACNPDRSLRRMSADLPVMKTCCNNLPLSGTTPEEVSHARNVAQIDLKNEVTSIKLRRLSRRCADLIVFGFFYPPSSPQRNPKIGKWLELRSDMGFQHPLHDRGRSSPAHRTVFPLLQRLQRR